MKRALVCALLLALPSLAQEEPTPFWLAPPPPKKSSEKKPPAQKKKPAEETPPAQKKRQPPVKAEQPKPVPWQKPAEPPYPPPEKKAGAPSERRIAPPQREVAPPQRKVVPPPERKVVAPPERKFVAPPEKKVVVPPVTPAPEPTPDLPARRPRAPIVEQPAPTPAPSVVERPAPVVEKPAPAPSPEPEPEEAPQKDVKHISLDVFAGFWDRSSSDGASGAWDFAYGIRGGYAFLDDRLEADLLALRTSATEGSPFLSTTLAHDLIEARGFYVIGDRFAFLAGLGAGIAIAQTHYSVVDPVAGSSSSLDASAYKIVCSVTAAGRVRIWGGLEARAEVNLLLRDGRLELLPLAGIGFAFW